MSQSTQFLMIRHEHSTSPKVIGMYNVESFYNIGGYFISQYNNLWQCVEGITLGHKGSWLLKKAKIVKMGTKK